MRTILKDNEPWFVAKDVCQCLDLSNPTVSLQRLDNDEVTKFNLGGLSGETNIVNEYGLYNLVLGSRKKEAKEFKRWITHQVIPQIRKTGSYLPDFSNPAEAISRNQRRGQRRTKHRCRKLSDTIRRARTNENNTGYERNQQMALQ